MWYNRMPTMHIPEQTYADYLMHADGDVKKAKELIKEHLAVRGLPSTAEDATNTQSIQPEEWPHRNPKRASIKGYTERLCIEQEGGSSPRPTWMYFNDLEAKLLIEYILTNTPIGIDDLDLEN